MKPNEQLFAPWRLFYLQNLEGKREGCIFCQFPQENRDEETYILHRGEHAFVILNAFPYASGHLMVIPFRHVARISDLNDAELLEVNQLVARATEALQKTYNPEGFNIGVNMGSAAGAGIPDHLHWHVVPRWSADINFMTAVGGVRVIPEELSTAYAKIKANLV